jgi:hypothetical protein
MNETSTNNPLQPEITNEIAWAREAIGKVRAEVHKVIVGQEQVLDEVLLAMVCAGHSVVEGVPGLAKTLLISTLAKCLTLQFSRIQFTPDLMPSDITGTEVIEEDRSTGMRSLRFVRGPIFANIVLADEINRMREREAGMTVQLSRAEANLQRKMEMIEILKGQLDEADKIKNKRLELWQNYYEAFAHLADRGRVELPSIPIDCAHCAHMFYLKLRDKRDRCAFMAYLKEAEILSVFHYIPLHSSPAGKKFGRFHGEDIFTTQESERLVRLPLFFNLIPVNQRTVINTVLSYFG